MAEKLLHVIAVAHRRLPELRVFVQSWINQTSNDWSMTIIHDGECTEFSSLMREKHYSHPSIEHFCTKNRHNDYGHTLRNKGLKQATGTYTLLTNCDNYFVPKTVELISKAYAQSLRESSEAPDIFIFDMIHSHNNPGLRRQPPYSYFEVEFKPYCIDISSAIVKTELAKAVGFRSKLQDGDQTYFDDIAERRKNVSVKKINHVLLVHN